MVTHAVFYSKCRPQGCDVIGLVKKHNVIFIGHPIWKKGWDEVVNPNRVSEALIHPRHRWTRNAEIDTDECSIRKASENHNLEDVVIPGSLMLIPRVREGKCYIGRVTRKLELAANLPWLYEYFDLRKEQGLSCDDPLGHAADVCQHWRIDSRGLVSVPLLQIPGWILYRLMARNTAGQVYSSPNRQSSYEIVEKLYRGDSVIDLEPTSDVSAVKRRLEDKMMPPHFEHLCVDLLNLERSNEIWWHTGGIADSRADGVAISDERRSILQCKLHLQMDPHSEANSLALAGADENEFILTSLFHPVPNSTLKQGVTFWGADHIAKLVLKHADRLPMAKALGVKVT